MSDLGKGTFGKVISCLDRRSGARVAVKIVRSVPRYLDSVREEAGVLFKVNAMEEEEDASQRLRCVKLLMHFSLAQGPHECLVFEQLGCSLLAAQERCQFRALYLPTIRHIVLDVLLALRFLHERVGLVHTDLKMENVLFVRAEVWDVDLSAAKDLPYIRRWFGVKLIDFGNAHYLGSSSPQSTTINTRQYRAPEVILELPWDQSSDVFGVGCLAMELFLGHVLFQSYSVPQHLAMMERVRDRHRFSQWMVHHSPIAADVFSPRDQRVVVRDARERDEVAQMSSLGDMIFARSRAHWGGGGEDDLRDFYHVVWDMLSLDPRRRISASEAAQQRWFSPYH